MINTDFALHLVQQHGSPIYAYDLDAVNSQAETLRSSVPARSSLYYSLKANPNVNIARTALQAGCRAEISSVGELRAALSAGFSPGDLLYTGPGKGQEEIAAALMAGVRFFSCESPWDLGRIREGARTTGVCANVIVRINPSHPPHSALAMSGGPSQFGFDEEELITGHLDWPSSDSHVRICGIHVYFGSQITPAAALLDAFSAALETVDRILRTYCIECKAIDIGGGFAWPYATEGEGEDLSSLRKKLTEMLDKRPRISGAEIWFESGRYIAASSGTYLTSIVDVKISKGKTYVVLDGGINHLGGMSGLGRIPRGNMSFAPLRTGSPSGEPFVADIVGPLCSPLDCLGRNIAMPAIAPGDVLAIPNVGAYGLTASLTAFLGRRPPAEIAYRGERVEGISRLPSLFSLPKPSEAGERFGS
jgi:diaminopimelate decarboxylase